MDTELWTYRDTVFAPGTERTGTMDLAGFDIQARDGSIGKIDEATNETGRACMVVDTGPWIFGRKVLIPAGTVERVDLDNRTVFVNLTKEQIKNSPEFDPDRGYDDAEYRTELGTYYTRLGVVTRAA